VNGTAVMLLLRRSNTTVQCAILHSIRTIAVDERQMTFSMPAKTRAVLSGLKQITGQESKTAAIINQQLLTMTERISHLGCIYVQLFSHNAQLPKTGRNETAVTVKIIAATVWY